MEKSLPIGALSEATGVKVPTIRYYENVGLMPTAPRSDGNRRLYDENAVGRLRFIRHARELGFEVNDIRQLLDLSDQPDRPCREVDAIAQRHLVEINGRIKRLKALKIEVARMIGECSKGCVSECRIIDALAHHEHCIHEQH